MVGAEGVEPPVFTLWVAGLQPAALATKRHVALVSELLKVADFRLRRELYQTD